MKCLWCKKESGRNKYCCPKCNLKDYYQKHKDFRISKAKEWNEKNPEKRRIGSKESFKKFKIENPERIREHARNQYRRGKRKADSRCKTWRIIKEGTIQIDKICKKCGTKMKVEIHHEVYPISRNGIIKAISDGKIYYLCRKCHINHHKQKGRF